MAFGETVATYTRFYLITSLPHDATRAAANVVLVVVVGGPIVRLLERYRSRFTWQPVDFEPAPMEEPAPGDAILPGSV